MVCADARGGRCRRRPSTNVACGGGCPRASADPRVVNWMEDDPTSRGSDRGSKEQNVYRFRGRRGGILDPSLSRYARCARTCTPRTGRARSLIRGCGASGDRCNAFRSVFVFRAAAISESAYPPPNQAVACHWALWWGIFSTLHGQERRQFELEARDHTTGTASKTGTRGMQPSIPTCAEYRSLPIPCLHYPPSTDSTHPRNIGGALRPCASAVARTASGY